MVDDASIVAVATDVWATMLERDLVAVPSDAVAFTAGETLDGIVSITGAWHGAVVVRISRRLAADVARTLLSLGDEEPTSTDLQDAVGELTNTTGGNIKGLMDGFCHLSLPTVVEGVDYRLRVPSASVVSECGFLCNDEPMVVRLIAAGAPM